jgi:lipopolysaccharide transport system ATP-binding protein
VTLASVEAKLYEGYQQGSVSEQVFRPKIREHCRVRRAGTFTVGYHPNAKLLHHGLANLPGTLRAVVSEAHTDAIQRAGPRNPGWLASARTIWRSRAATAVASRGPTPPAAPAAATADTPTIFHVTHWKAGSQWIFEILRYCAPDKIVEPQVGEAQFLHHPLQAGKIYPTVYVTKQQFDGVAKPEHSRRFVVIRDLRDTLISAYFSIKVSHTLQTWMHDYQRVALQSMSLEDGLIYLMDEWLTGCARIQLSWLDADEPVLRYNDLLEHDTDILERVLLDECQLDVSRERFREAVLANRFEKMSGGRARGREDISAHMRKGISGDWRNYFTDRVKRAFKMRYGSLLVAAGDEQDLNW